MEFASSRSLMTTYRWCWCSCCFCAFSCCCCRCCTPRYSMTTYRLNNLQLVWKLRCIFVCMQIVFCETLDLVSGDHRFYGDSSKQDPMPRQILMNLIRNFKSDNCPMTQYQVNKTYFHPRCMKCQVCGELQTSRYITYKDLPICEEHYKVCITHKCITLAIHR